MSRRGAKVCAGGKDGLDLKQLITIISAAGGKIGMLDLYGQAKLDGDFTPLMSLANARKDVRYYARWLKMLDCRASWPTPCTRPTGRPLCSGMTRILHRRDVGKEAVTGVEARVRP